MKKRKQLTNDEKQQLNEAVRKIQSIADEYRENGSFKNYTPSEVIEKYTQLESLINQLNPELWKQLD